MDSATMPLLDLSRRFAKRTRRARSSPPGRDALSLHTPRTASPAAFYTHTPPRTPSPMSECLQQGSTCTSTSSLDKLSRIVDPAVPEPFSLANSGPPQKAFNPDTSSTNDPMVNPEEHVIEPSESPAETDPLTIINPDTLDTEIEQLQEGPRADNCMFVVVVLLAVVGWKWFPQANVALIDCCR